MDKKEAAHITINVYGNHCQILPNAEQAVQHFYGTTPDNASAVPGHDKERNSSSEATRLSLYINNVEQTESFLAQLRACCKAKEVGYAVVELVQGSGTLSEKDMVRKEFIELLLSLTPRVESGKTIDNYRKYINEAWCDHRKKTP